MIAPDALAALRSPLFSYALNLCREYTLAEDLVSEAVLAFIETPSEDDLAGRTMRASIDRFWKREQRRRQRLPEAMPVEISVSIAGHVYSNPPGRSSHDPYLLRCHSCGDVLARCSCRERE